MKKGFIALMIAACLGLAGVMVFLRFTEDRKAPEIHFQDNEITYVQGDDYEGLLLGVTATDNKDGDVTDSLVVESVYPNDDGGTATIVYVARDSSNNISKANKIVKYQTDSEDAAETDDDSVSGTGDNDAQEATKVNPATSPEPTQNNGGSAAGTSDNGQSQLTNQESDSENETEDESEEDLPEGSPRIKLSKNKVTITRGDSVNRISFVESITDDKDDENTLWRRIEIAGDEFDRNTPGTYEQIYYVIDSDGNKSNEAKLTIVVQ